MTGMLFMSCDSPTSAPQATPTAGSGAASQAAPPSAQPTAKKVSTAKARLPGHGQPFMDGEPKLVHVIGWGGDFPLLYCAGGERTRKGTICEKYGVNIKIKRGDDMAAQLASYEAGQTPLLRGTYGMVGKYWQRLCKNPDLCPKWLFAETKSAGDYLTCRDHIKTVADLLTCKGSSNQDRKCRITLQKDGPWDKFVLQVIVEDAKGKWDDIEFVWAKDLTGPGDSPDTRFRNDPTIDCAMGITPDMINATGGVTSKGTGADKTIKGAHVVTSTFHRRDAGIIDGFAVSSKFAAADSKWMHAFAAAYEKASEDLKRLNRANQAGGSEEYEGVMLAMVDFYGKDTLPDEVEADGLYQDASFLGIAGNVRFFDRTNKTGIAYHEKWANALAKIQGTASSAVTMEGPALDFGHSIFNAMASRNVRTAPKLNIEATRKELDAMSAGGTLGTNMMVSYTALFGVDEDVIKDFKPYHTAFNEIMATSARYSRAPIVIRGHYDSTGLVVEIILWGMREGFIKKQGTPGNWRYYKDGAEISLDNLRPWMDVLQSGQGVDRQGIALTQYITEAEARSRKRAEALARGLQSYAKKKNDPIDPSLIQTEAVGMREPVVVKARSPEQSAQNRRVEFSVVKTSGESLSASDYEL